jgi:SAM-dependent methyltransferase
MTTTIDIDADGWPGDGERFELVRSADTLAAASDPGAAVERLLALLAPGGVLVVGVPGGDREAEARRALTERFASVRYAVRGGEPDGRLVAVGFSASEDQTQRWLDLLDQQWELLAQLDAELAQARALIDSARPARDGGVRGRLGALARRLSR